MPTKNEYSALEANFKLKVQTKGPLAQTVDQIKKALNCYCKTNKLFGMEKVELEKPCQFDFSPVKSTSQK